MPAIATRAMVNIHMLSPPSMRHIMAETRLDLTAHHRHHPHLPVHSLTFTALSTRVLPFLRPRLRRTRNRTSSNRLRRIRHHHLRRVHLKYRPMPTGPITQRPPEVGLTHDTLRRPSMARAVALVSDNSNRSHVITEFMIRSITSMAPQTPPRLISTSTRVATT